MNQSATLHVGIAGREIARNTDTQRWGAVLGGGALAIYGLSRRSPFGIAMAATGGALAFYGARAETSRQETEARTTVLLNCQPSEAYRFVRDFDNLPLFMTHIESVTATADRRSRWVALGPMGRRLTWDAEIDVDRENEYISWHSLPGSEIRVSGFVAFRHAPGNRGTLLEAFMEIKPLKRALAFTAARMLGKYPNFVLRQDLRRLKALIETGEIPTTEGQTHGPRSAIAAIARVADPTRPIRGDARIVDVFEAKRRIS